MKKLFLYNLLFLWFITTQGCVTVSGLNVAKLTFTPNDLVEKYYTKALIHEQKGELYKALYLYKTAGNLAPGRADISQKIKEVARTAREAADAHYQTGLVYQEQEKMKAARREFMIALRHVPHHKKSLHTLRQSYENEIFTIHQTVKGETPRQISATYYNDESFAFLVAYFNGFTIDDTLAADTALRIPSVARNLLSETESMQSREENIDQQDIESIGKAYENSSTPSKPAQLLDKNEVLLQHGLQLMREGNLIQSLAVLEQVDKSFKSIDHTIADLKTRMRAEADAYYKTGVKYFVKEQLEAAIAAWHKTLELYPKHPKALDDINKARSLLMRLQNIKK